jgi:hypothetical protein
MLTHVWRRTADTPRTLVVATPTDAELVAACLAGTRDAFDTIVERHQRQVYQLCFRFVGNHEDASDLAQDVFVRAYRGLHRFKGDASRRDARSFPRAASRAVRRLPYPGSCHPRDTA